MQSDALADADMRRHVEMMRAALEQIRDAANSSAAPMDRLGAIREIACDALAEFEQIIPATAGGSHSQSRSACADGRSRMLPTSHDVPSKGAM